MEDSLTSGRISVVVPEEARVLATREAEAFRRTYPESDLDLRVATSREAIASLLDATAQLAMVSRELEPDERAAAVRGRIALDGYRFARDAIVMIVHPSNPVRTLGVDELRNLYGAAAPRWSSFGGHDRAVRPVIRPVQSDITLGFAQEVMGGNPIAAPSLLAASDSEVVARVAGDPDAIGYVTLSAPLQGVRALAISPLAGLPAIEADAETVHEQSYPLTRSYNLYVRDAGPRLAAGFVTFITSQDGQRLVHDYGLVPTAVPLRFVRRSPMQGIH